MTDTKSRPYSQVEIQQQCFKSMKDHGLVPPSTIVFRTDTHMERVRLRGKPKGNRDGSYAAYENPHSYTLLVWNWTDGGDQYKLVIPKNGEPLTAEQKKEDRAFQEKLKQKADNDKAEKNKLTAQRTNWLINEAKGRVKAASPTHPYLKRKDVQPIGIYELVVTVNRNWFHREFKVDDLIIPLRDFNKKIWSFQFIKPDGTKLFPFGGKKTGLFFRFPGNGKNPMPHFCEGYATGADINRATGANVYVCFDKGNLRAVVEEYLKAKPPTEGDVLTMVICGDNDKWYYQWKEGGEKKQGKDAPEGAQTVLVKRDPNPGKVWALKAKERAEKVPGVEVVVALPEFKTDDPHMSDFNDLRHEQGIEAVGNQIDLAVMLGDFEILDGDEGDGMKTELKGDGDEFIWFYEHGAGEITGAEVIDDEEEEDVSALPDFKEEYVHPLVYEACSDYAKAFDVGIEVPVFSLLPTVGACIGKKRRIQIKVGWEEYSNLYLCMVAMSGTGKSPCLKAIQEALIEKEESWAAIYNIGMDMYEAEKAIWDKTKVKEGTGAPPKKPDREEVILDNVTPEQMEEALLKNSRGMLFNTDELSWLFHNLGRYSHSAEGQKARFLGAYDSKSIKNDRKSDTRAKFTKEACLSIYGNMTPSNMKDVFSLKDAHSGLVPRFQFITLPDNGPPKISYHSYSDGSAETIRKTIQGCLDLKAGDDGKPIDVVVSRDAFAVFEPWANGILNRYYYSNKQGIYLPMAKKIVARAMRFALIDHCVSDILGWSGSRADKITPDKMETMIKFGDYLMAHQINVWERYLGDKVKVPPKPIESRVADAITRLMPEAVEGFLPTRRITELINEGAGKDQAISGVVIGRTFKSFGITRVKSSGVRGVRIPPDMVKKLKKVAAEGFRNGQKSVSNNIVDIFS